MKKVFVFDLDGVILNNLEAHHNCFRKFLENHKIDFSKDDFKEFNGPKIEEMVKLIKKKYSINKKESELLRCYEDLMEQIYLKSELNEDVIKLCEELSNENFLLALASSARRKYILYSLNKNKLSNFFSFIASGDDVKAAKPAPDIYELVKKNFGECYYIAIEDSDNGMISAKSAGMNVIFFNPENRKTDVVFDYEVTCIKKVIELMTKLN